MCDPLLTRSSPRVQTDFRGMSSDEGLGPDSVCLGGIKPGLKIDQRNYVFVLF